MKSILCIAIAFAMIAGFSSCSKDEAAPDNRTPDVVLLAYKWKLDAYTVTPGIKLSEDSPEITDLYSKIPDCEKDDYSTFTDPSITAGTIGYYSGASKCASTEDTASTADRYNFDPNTMVLTTSTSSIAKTFRYNKTAMTATQIKSTGMILTYQADGDGDGVVNNYTLSYKVK
jgi:hypothetical protein